MSAENVIQSRDDFTDDKVGWAKRWATEIEASRKWSAAYQASAAVSVERFLDKRDERMPDGQTRPDDEKRSRVNLFWSNVVTQRALLYGRVPEVDVKRRYDDARDDEARVAGPVILERLLNTDIERSEDGFRSSLRHSLSDYLNVGLGFDRIRYVVELEDFEKPELADAKGRKAPAVKGKRKVRGPDGLPKEDVVTDYIHWRDMLWSPCRTFEGMRWWGFKTPMSRDEMKKRFGQDVAQKVSYALKLINTGTQAGESNEDPRRQDPWQRCEVWEIWSKEEMKVFWWVEGYAECLDIRDDPYKLRGFWPFPEPLMANLTTEAFLPRSDYAMAQDLYNDINEQSSRIALLERALKVAGVYDQACGPLERLVTEGFDNVLIPVEKWPALQEKGGIAGAINWLPLDQIVLALEKLHAQRDATRQLLYEVTGQSDLMRGQAEDGSESGTAAAGKIRFGSVRMQHRQDEFAAFASRLQCLRAELIIKLFDDETIAHRANVDFTEDGPEAARQAIEMLKREYPNYRVEVKPEAIAQQDFAALKNERMEVLTAIGGLAQSATAMTQVLGPAALPVFAELARWAVAGLRGAGSIEGVFDKALRQAEDAAKQMQAQGGGQPPDPKVQAQQQKAQLDAQTAQLKSQLDSQKTQQELQADLIRQRAEVDADRQRQEAQAQFNIAEARASEAAKVEAERVKAQLRPPPAAPAPARPAAPRPRRKP